MNGTNPAQKQYPVFPLRSVLFPGHSLPLKIFEPRYLKMLEDCEKSGEKQFVIALISSGSEVGEGATPYRVGCLVQYENVLQSQGLSFITPTAIKRVYIEDFLRDAGPYLLGQCLDYSDEEPCDIPPTELGTIEKKLSNIWISGGGARSKEAFSKLLLKKNKLSMENYTLFLAGCLRIPLINLQNLLESKSGSYRIQNIANLLKIQTKTPE